ncbi:unnamed protein product [Pieris macdunnoughi]|uniref:Uncharacterized protein n=1 Tax=Pieris macdunnoughi TaxID=345717 RepID=A0A821WSK0_9NEOP|nr:unnamed protein product [Pieris macdunnoughi]
MTSIPQSSLSFPGPSGLRSNLGLARSSHRLLRARSKSVPKDMNSAEKKSSHGLKLLLKRKSKHKGLDKTTSTSNFTDKTKESCLNACEEKISRIALSTPNLSEENAQDVCQLPPCGCASSNVIDVMSRWDSLVLVLLFAMIIAYIMSSPLSFLFPRQSRQE